MLFVYLLHFSSNVRLKLHILQVLPTIPYKLAPKILEPCDQYSPGSLPPARSIEKRLCTRLHCVTFFKD